MKQKHQEYRAGDYGASVENRVQSEQTTEIEGQQPEDENNNQIRLILTNNILWEKRPDPKQIQYDNSKKNTIRQAETLLTNLKNLTNFFQMPPVKAFAILRNIAHEKGLKLNEMGGTWLDPIVYHFSKLKKASDTKLNKERQKNPPSYYKKHHRHNNTIRTSDSSNTSAANSEPGSLSLDQKKARIHNMIHAIGEMFIRWLHKEMNTRDGISKQQLESIEFLNTIPGFTDAYHDWVRHLKNQILKHSIDKQIFDEEMNEQLMECLKNALKKYLGRSTDLTTLPRAGINRLPTFSRRSNRKR